MTHAEPPASAGEPAASPAREPRTVVAVRALLCVATLLLLVASTYAMLATACLRPDADKTSWTVAVPADGTVRIERILADGRRLRPSETTSTRGLEPGAGPFDPLATQRGGEASTLTFTAAHAVMTVARHPGTIPVAIGRTGELPQSIVPAAADGGEVHVDLPLAPPASVAWPAVAAAGALLLAVLRPWRGGKATSVWLIAHVAAAHALVWLTLPTGTNNDAPCYISYLELNLAGVPTYFPPGYGLLMAAARAVHPDAIGGVVTFFQHAMMVATLAWSQALVRSFAGPTLACAYLFVTGWLSPTLFLPQILQSENLALFATAGALRAALAARGPGVTVVAAGLLAALATLARVASIVGLAPALLAVACSRLRPLAAVRRTAATLAVAGLPLAALMGWFWLHVHTVVLTTGTGRHLYNRAVSCQKLLDPEGRATRAVQGLLPGVDLRSLYHWELNDRLLACGLGYHEVEFVIEAVAHEAVRSDPIGYLRFTPGHAWRLLTADASTGLSPWADTSDAFAMLETPPPLAPTASALRHVQRLHSASGLLWPIACWLALAAVVLLPFQRPFWLPVALTAMTAGCILVTASFEILVARYNTGVTPFVLGLAVVPFALVARVIPQRSRPATWPASARPAATPRASSPRASD